MAVKGIVVVNDTTGYPRQEVQADNPSAGDLFYYDGSYLSKLPIGNNGEILKSSGSVPYWGPDTGTIPIHYDSVDVSIAAGEDYITGTVNTLPSTPSNIVPSMGRDITSGVIDDDYYFTLEVSEIITNGFKYVVRVFEEGEQFPWQGQTINVRFDYFWGE